MAETRSCAMHRCVRHKATLRGMPRAKDGHNSSPAWRDGWRWVVDVDACMPTYPGHLLGSKRRRIQQGQQQKAS